MDALTQVRFIWKPMVFLACLAPMIHAVGDICGITGTLGANPIENLQDRFGVWGLRFILIALAKHSIPLSLPHPIIRSVTTLWRKQTFPRLLRG